MLLVLNPVTAARAQPLESQLSQPEATPSDFFETPVLTAPMLSAEISAEAFCASVQSFLGVAGEQEDTAELRDCSFEAGRFFVLVRANEASVRTARIKLNSTAPTERADLESLGQLASSMMQRLGWKLPESVATAMLEGRRHRCRVGTLSFDFAKERGEVPRYNLIIGISNQPADTTESFGPWVMPC
jgi:hypothetical protein